MSTDEEIKTELGESILAKLIYDERNECVRYVETQVTHRPLTSTELAIVGCVSGYVTAIVLEYEEELKCQSTPSTK